MRESLEAQSDDEVRKGKIQILAQLTRLRQICCNPSLLYEDYKEELEFFYIRILLCSSLSRICRIPKKEERKYALNENWKMLYDNFPYWHKNKYLKSLHTPKGLFMKSINRVTYKFYSWFLPKYYRV